MVSAMVTSAQHPLSSEYLSQVPQTDGFAAVISTPLAFSQMHLGIRCDSTSLLGIDMLYGEHELKSPDTGMAKRIVAQLEAWFADGRFVFDLPVRFDGTAFQQRVWKSLQSIPAGSTMYYGELAQKIDSGPRAIGGACRRNPVPIVVPCHRVVAKQGPGGFDGATSGRNISVKQWLLAHESRI